MTTEQQAMEIKLAQLDELLARLLLLESPPLVEFQGQEYPALPLADARFFAARRISALDQKIRVLRQLERHDEADEVFRTRNRVRVIWDQLTRGGIR